MKSALSHLDSNGRARMVDVGAKPAATREALAFGEVRGSPELLGLIRSGRIPKGDVLAAARVAGIMAAKKTGELIPLCHPLCLDAVEIAFRLEPELVLVRARAKARGKTGVEMEALTAACVAGLTIYDMCKSIDKGMTIGPIYLARKSGGKSGVYAREGVPPDWLPRNASASDGGESAWL
ncbi:MAG: cyclic pyranopterin monophosphate synthase MoaC [Elusimicrobia bacterium]|nr:cyclic pyranopterin monophosphate synthase MoaC [Elusimicrobiota bacterium]